MTISTAPSPASLYPLELGDPKLDIIFQVWPHLRKIEEGGNFFSPGGHFSANVAWYVV